jgi:hypothetical protein
LTLFESRIKVIGQPPLCADRFDDKSFVNDELRRYGGLTLPMSWTVDDHDGQRNLDSVLASIKESDYPIVAKPVRGRGSHGVKICENATELTEHITQLFNESPRLLLEEYLNGEEGTITIMPPQQSAHGSELSERYSNHWALPPVTRFNHVDGIAPYSGKVAVTVNLDQTSLMGLAAKSMGWDYPTFLQYVPGSAQCLARLRNYTSPLLSWPAM